MINQKLILQNLSLSKHTEIYLNRLENLDELKKNNLSKKIEDGDETIIDYLGKIDGLVNFIDKANDLQNYRTVFRLNFILNKLINDFLNLI